VKTYWTDSGRVRALEGIDIDLPWAAVSALVGPSGSGKSSLLRLLAGMDRPTTGTVVVDGVDLTALSSRRLRRIRDGVVGYIFQRPSDNFVSYLTVVEHLRLASGRSPHPNAPEADEILEKLEIAHRRDHLPHELSGGEQQRAAFAQVMMTGPRVVVADEPTAELDSASGEALLEVVRDLTRAGTAFVIATHDPKVSRMADTSIEIDHGLLKGAHAHDTKIHASQTRDVVAAARGSALYMRPSAVRSSVPEVSPTQFAERSRIQLLQLDGVTKTYTRGSEIVHAVEDVSLDLPSAHLLGLMGRSGSGKTTLLNLLAGWESPDGGSISWAGKEMEHTDNLPWSDVAVVPQKLGLIEELSVRKNIEYPARLDGRLDEMGERVDELLAELGLEELQDRVPLETSVGQQQRTALARALLLRPRLLLADEPSGHQDALWARGVFRVLRAAAEEGTCCLVATHNEEIASYFDAIFHMADGHLVDEVRPRESGTLSRP
jgi:ABC-type lipoprotein export system ATPase subunit